MQTCRFPNGQGGACLKVCQKGCFCKPGYVKNDLGKCILSKDCLKLTCLKNEVYECRNPTCEPGCLIKPCKSVNCENKCYCRDGYVKENRTCILLATCESKLNNNLNIQTQIQYLFYSQNVMIQMLLTIIVNLDVLIPLVGILVIILHCVKETVDLDAFVRKVTLRTILANVFFLIIVHVSIRNQLIN